MKNLEKIAYTSLEESCPAPSRKMQSAMYRMSWHCLEVHQTFQHLREDGPSINSEENNSVIIVVSGLYIRGGEGTR
jgi:hypothetical protein